MRPLLRPQTTFTLVLLGMAAACAHPAPPPPDGHAAIEGWERRHPAASRDLGSWVRDHPEAAARTFRWDSHHSGAAEAFVNWSLANPGAEVDDFARTHRSWEEFNWLMEHHRSATNSFMVWCRRHPEASRELMHYRAGLYWAGTHLYQSYWDMKHPA